MHKDGFKERGGRERYRNIERHAEKERKKEGNKRGTERWKK